MIFGQGTSNVVYSDLETPQSVKLILPATGNIQRAFDDTNSSKNNIPKE